MNYEQLLARIIDDGIAEVQEAYADPSEHPKRDGSIRGFEACRGKTPAQLVEFYVQAERETAELQRANMAATGFGNAGCHDVYWDQAYYTMQIEWCCNVLSVGLPVPLLAWLPTMRGALKYAQIMGVPFERPEHAMKAKPLDMAATDTKPAALHTLPATAFPITIRIFSGKTGEVLWARTVPLPKPSTDLFKVDIPSFKDTEHYPVSSEVEYADGTIERGLAP